MPSSRISSRPIQARPGKFVPARWIAATLLFLCGLLSPTAAFAAPTLAPKPAPSVAPLAQSGTFQRFVDGIAGSDTDDEDEECTRKHEGGVYTYYSCATITRALAVANSGDVIYVAGGLVDGNGTVLLGSITYSGNITVDKKVTIIGGYPTGFDNEIEPVAHPGLSTIISGAAITSGGCQIPGPPGQPPLLPTTQVVYQDLTITSGGLDILLSCALPGPLFYANNVVVTLDGVTVREVSDGGSGINVAGAGNKLITKDSIIRDNGTNNANGTTRNPGIFAGGSTILDLGAGTIVSGNNNTGGNGGGISASGAATVTIGGGVTINSNFAANGGGIYASNSILNIGTDTIVRDNSATVGAGIYLSGGTNKVSGAQIINNGSGSTTSGGGIYVSGGAPTLENLKITQNDAQNGGGVYLTGLANGGTLSSSDLLSNTATTGGGGYYINTSAIFTASSLLVQANSATHGGGAYLTGATNAVIQGNSFVTNTATNNGGGLFVISSNAARLQSNSFTINKANSGGGLYIENSSSVLAPSSTFDGNTANFGSGLYAVSAVATFASATFQNNISTNNGAGLYADGGNLTFTGSAFFQNNKATGQGGGGYLTGGGQLNFASLDLQGNEAATGGGFYVTGSTFNATGASSFLTNKAKSGNGGSLYLTGSVSVNIANLFAQSNEGNSGGAIYADGGNIVLKTLNLSGNSAKSGNGGGAYFANATVTFGNVTPPSSAATFIDNKASQNGGAIYASSTSLNFQNGAQFNNNQAQGGNGGAVYHTGTSSHSATFNVSTFLENRASSSGGGLYANNTTVSFSATSKFESNVAQAQDGGGFYINGSTLSLSGLIFKNNRAFVNGGGGYLNTGTLSLLADALFDENQAQTGNGGGLAVSSASTTVINHTIFSKNQANLDGGALYFSNTPLTVQMTSTFDTNTAAAGRGGAIFATGNNATIQNGNSFSKNKANTGGGALYLTNINVATLQNNGFSENDGGTTTGVGGGLYLKANSATITNDSYSKNLANNGAGLYLFETPVATLTNLQFIENSSTGGGGALFFNNSKARLNSLTVRANQAAGEGGGIYGLYSQVGTTNTLIVANKVTAVANYGAGVYLANTNLDLVHSTIANNSHQQLQGTAHAVYVAPPLGSPPGGAPTASALTIINSIVSGQAVGVNLLAGNSATFDAVLWNNTGFNWTGAGTFSVSRSRRGDPRFVAVASNDYHLRRDSAAFDQGIITSVLTDRDGVARTQSLAPDLGAYEHRYNAGLYLTTSISPPFVRNGDNVTLNLRIRNQGASAANNVVLNAQLPTQLPAPSASAPGGYTSLGCQGIFCSVTWASLAPGADVTVAINVVVNGTALNSGLLALLTNISLQTSNLPTSDTAATATAYLHGCLANLNGTIYHTVQAAHDAASNGQLIRISGVCGDIHQNNGPGQLLAITKNITLQGGWNSTFTTLDPIAFPTYLESGALGRVVYINGNYSPVFENIFFRNGNSTALGGGPSGKDAGGGIYINGGTPLFKNVEIANSQSPDLGAGLYLASPNVINFQGGAIRGNTAGERGGGIYINSSAPVFTGVNIISNNARGGGGAYLYQSPAQFIDDAPVGSAPVGSAPTCRIDNNTSTVLPNYVPGPSGGGLPVLWLAPGGGGGIVLDESAAILRGCAINANTARVGGGAYIHNSTATIENSLFTANRAQQPAPTTILIGPGGVRDGDGGGIVLDNLDPTLITLRGLLLGKNEGVRGSGMLTRFARAGTLNLPHFTINSNSGGTAVFALGESRLAFFNTIVAFNVGGAALFAQAGSSGETASITLDHTLFHPPTQTKFGSSGGGTTASTVEFTGDPAFRDDGYHLKRISFAYGVGTNSFSFADRDGNARPVGASVELGADEYATDVVVRYVAPGGAGSAPCTDYRSPCASLQTALDAASNGDFIKMAGGAYSGVRNDSGRIHHARIEKSVTIEGGYFPRTDNNAVTDKLYTLNDWESPHPIETPTVIDVNEQGRVFYISGVTTPTLSLLTLRRGNALSLGDGPVGSTGGGGGGVYVDGAAPLFKNVLVEDSRANFGSGFYLRNAGGNYLGVTLLENGTGVSDGRGGGFYIQGGQPTLQNMTIQANLAITGAGIYLDNSAATLIQNTIQNNGNSTTLDGGGIFVLTGTVSLITNTVANNQAQHGGGLRLQNSNATLRGNVINNNRAGTNPAPAGQSDGLGGGLYVVGGAPQLIANTVSNNQVVHPVLSFGGGIYVAQTAMMMNANVINNNIAHRGAGLYLATTKNIVVQNNTFTANQAQAPNENLRPSGGGVYFATAAITFTTNTLNQNGALYGAGLYVEGLGQSKINQNTLSANVASKDGGAIYLDGSDALLDGNTLQSNISTTGRGGALYARNGQSTLRANSFLLNQAGLEGGAIYLSVDSATVENGTINGNLAGDGAGIYIDGPAPGAAQAPPWINHVTLSNNNASNHGGAIFMRKSGAQITLNTVDGNHAAVDGGGVYLNESIPSNFSGNLIRNNSAGDQGGGLFLTRLSSGRYQSNAVIDNSAVSGGGIFVGGASPTFVHTTIARNGSGLVAMILDGNPTTVILSNTIVSGHTSAFGIEASEGANVSAFTTLWHNNLADFFGSGNISSNDDISGDPSFLPDGYHIDATSAAANEGLAGDVAVGSDVDNEGRFQGSGPEIGADELTAVCEVIVEGAPNVVYGTLQQAINSAPDNPSVVLLVAGTCTGVETNAGTPQLAYFTRNLTVRGGYASGSWDVSSPAKQPSVLDARGLGRVIRVAAGVRVVLTNLTLINGSALGLGGGPSNVDAGGVLLVNDAQISMDNVAVVNGRANVGGGLYLKTTNSLVANGAFRNNQASLSGGAIYLDGAPVTAEMRGTLFANNRAMDGGAIFAQLGAPTILYNRLNENLAAGGGGRGGGIFLNGTTSLVNRNQLESNRAGSGGGLFIFGGTPNVTNNMLIRNVGISNAGALYSINSAQHVRNNTFVANSTVQNGGSAIYFDTSATPQALLLTNNIIVNHAIALDVAANNTMNVRGNLWNANQTNWLGSITEGTNNIYQQDPLFVNSGAGNYHILENSPAVDHGVNIGVTDDIDGQSRPARQGFDIGADEYLRPSVNATLNALPNPVASGGKQTYVLRVINNGDIDITARVQLTLPNVLAPQSSPLWENVFILRGAVWERTLVAVVDKDYTGTLTAVMGVTTAEGAVATATADSTAAAVSADLFGFSGESAPNPAKPGSSVELNLRIVNHGAIPIGTRIQTQLPAGLTTSSPLIYTPTIAASEGIWSTRLNLNIAANVPTQTPSGGFNQLVTTFLIESDQGTSHTFSITTTIAHPAIQIQRIPTPRPAIAGKQLLYTLLVTNTGNIGLPSTITSVFPPQVALDDIAQAQPIQTTLSPGQVLKVPMSTTVEAGYVGPLVGTVGVTTDEGVSASAQDQLSAQKEEFTPTATAKGGDWHNPATWEPPVVPPSNANVLIPEDVAVYSNLPITVRGLVNRGNLDMRTLLGSSQAMSITNLLENYGFILGMDATGNGQAGLTLNVNSAILYNEGTICAGDGATNGGAGGDLIIIAGSTTNKGIFCAGHGADVVDASANLPGGAGGEVLLSFDPGLFTNVGQVLAGNGGNAFPGAIPAQAGGNGGDVTIVATAAARLRESDIRAGLGGQGSDSSLNGTIGKVVIGAPIIDSEGTRFSNGTVLLLDQNSESYNFAAIGPDIVTISAESGVAFFGIRVFNRGARQDTFVASPLTTPSGWTVNNLPAALNLRSFRSNLIFVLVTLPATASSQPVSNQPVSNQAVSEQTLTIVVSSQHDADNQIVIPLRIVMVEDGFRTRLPQVAR